MHIKEAAERDDSGSQRSGSRSSYYEPEDQGTGGGEHENRGETSDLAQSS